MVSNLVRYFLTSFVALALVGANPACSCATQSETSSPVSAVHGHDHHQGHAPSSAGDEQPLAPCRDDCTHCLGANWFKAPEGTMANGLAASISPIISAVLPVQLASIAKLTSGIPFPAWRSRAPPPPSPVTLKIRLLN